LSIFVAGGRPSLRRDACVCFVYQQAHIRNGKFTRRLTTQAALPCNKGSAQGQRYLADRQTRFRASVEGPAETAVAGDGAGAVAKKRGKPSVADTDFIVPLIHLHSSHSLLVSKYLNNDRDCNRAVKEALEETVNRRLDIEEEEAFAGL
jgi:hypothetical protein